MPDVTLTLHDSLPPEESAIVDAGLGRSNDEAAPLHEVQPLSCFVRDAEGRLLGGAIGRRWGACCELQQLWVEPAARGSGLGARLLRAFEAHARSRGCTSVVLETFSFQAPEFYRKLGYAVEHERRGFPHGIVKLLMGKNLADASPAA